MELRNDPEFIQTAAVLKYTAEQFRGLLDVLLPHADKDLLMVIFKEPAPTGRMRINSLSMNEWKQYREQGNGDIGDDEALQKIRDLVQFPCLFVVPKHNSSQSDTVWLGLVLPKQDC